MVNGRLRCLGSGQHLKNRFGSGYEIDIKTTPPDEASLQALGQHLIDRGAIRFATISPIVTRQSNDVSSYNEDLMSVRIAGPLHTLCATLNKPQRTALLAPGQDGQMLYEQLQVDGFITVKMFLDWWIAEDYADNIREFMARNFNNLPVLLERFSANSFRYRIPISVSELPLADIFEKFESVKDSLCIKDYAVGQTTLEQIFNQFASSQDNPEVEAQQMHVERQIQAQRAQAARERE